MVSITTAKVPGFTLQMYHDFNAKFPEHQAKLDKK
jgi:hypothetical protein